MSKPVLIYTDGSCLNNPGPGGWAAVLQYGDTEKVLSGGERDTTNNRMEMLAAIAALEALTRSSQVTIISDSTYLKDGITRWIKKWKSNGWKTASKKPVKNRDLWQRLDALIATHEVTWNWIKGHSGHPLNERCDDIARAEAEKIKYSL